MAAILEREPPSMTTVQPLLPPSLDHVVRRCLAKDPDERWQSAGDVMRELQWVAATRTQPGEIPQAAPRHARRERYLWMAVVAALAIVATGALIARRPPAAAPERRLEITTPATYDPMSLAVSPDGQRVVFVAMGEGSQQLWLRTIAGAASATQPLKGTDGAQFPFWSPDSRSIGFGASGQLKRVDIESGTVNWVANAPLFLGGAWSADGTIIFAPNSNSPLMRVSTDGGEPVAATTLSPVGAHSFPHLLPGGRHFLFYSVGERPGVYLGQVDATASRHLLDATATALYSPTGHLLFVRNGTLYAQRFDPDRLVLSGESVRVSDQVVMAPFAGAPLVAASTSAAGPIVFRSGPAITPYRFEVTRVDAAGNALQKIANEPVLLNPSLSPDGSQMAMFKNRHIWLLDVKTGAQRPLTNDAYVNFGAVWSPDGHRIAYSSQRGAVFDLYVRDATGAGAERQILTTPETKMPTDWSSAGYLLYRSLSAKDGFDIWALSMADGKTFPVVRTAAEERDGQFSPDGNWVAYQSNRTGRYEIWVAPFPFPGTDVGEGGGWQFTFGGGRQTRWGAGGKELFYTAPDGRLMSVPVTVQPGGRVLSPGTPRPLFQTTAINTGTAGPGYLVLSDGSFITTFAPVPATTTPITVLLDWKPPR
jgi:Tol biopolymer transport system component